MTAKIVPIDIPVILRVSVINTSMEDQLLLHKRAPVASSGAL